MKNYIKHMLVRTPLERPAMQLSHALRARRLHSHPELREIALEPRRIDQTLRRIIGRTSNCVDVGGHLGSVLSAIVRLGPQGRHHAFEPIPEKARWLRQKFPEVTVHELALAEESGEAEFFINRTRSGFSALRQRLANAQDSMLRIRVLTETLDQTLPRSYRVDFLKVDVEGGEFAVLRGADAVLRRCAPAILFESTRDGLAAFQLSTDDIFTYLSEGHGYEIRLLKDYLEGKQRLTREQFAEAHEYPFRGFNFVATSCRGRDIAQPHD